MERKIIFLDIDGTLTEPGSNEPPESAIRAVCQARKEGHYVFFVYRQELQHAVAVAAIWF